MQVIMYHSGYSICHIGITSAIQPKTITSALHIKYIYTNNGDTSSVTNNAVLKIFLGHINIKLTMVLVIYLG